MLNCETPGSSRTALDCTKRALSGGCLNFALVRPPRLIVGEERRDEVTTKGGAHKSGIPGHGIVTIRYDLCGSPSGAVSRTQSELPVPGLGDPNVAHAFVVSSDRY